ncbi:MAG: hypothetical protein UY23_C0003G0028 [Candidatus Jorgensenbacteria bacterium GW2011_GWA1_48_11]|uniref:Uncharacterized protein n=1 Tax=Candidatus Jorgensenbacteria bacterium GW2011_GWA1_48_11 TaxID=1618660 RepID=A0A0G1XA23_9BACT|nr:MAG: hypothetical protein UY23_C0003G0028 [Candidatus Jorgensenbacteria bacterium GW2011_GWA1_48_11]KKW11866.1 MAG: hypothetical protein UY51_C0005G0107 [Candidatus Jorgensenbacteria bacterium GW2011_GWB1_49_9]
MKKIQWSKSELTIVKALGSLLFLPIYSLGSKIDLLLVWDGLKPATDIIIGKQWAVGQKGEDLSEGEIENVRRVLKDAGLAFVETPKHEHVITGTRKSILYKYIDKEFFVARNITFAKELKRAAEPLNDELFGRLSGFPESAIKAYLKSRKKPNLIIVEKSSLPPEIKNQDFMAFATFGFSKENWQGELEIPKRWAAAIKRLDPKLYEEAVKSYKEISGQK